MNFFKKQFYGDYDSMQGGGNNTRPEEIDKRVSPGEINKNKEESQTKDEWPLWEIFIRSKQGLDHKHVGSLHAADVPMAIENARDVYTRRQEGVSIWVVESKYIHATNPDDADSLYDPANDKVYRHPTFYDLPDELTHM